MRLTKKLSITNIFIAINVVFFIFALILLYYNENFIDYLALKPANILAFRNLWTLLTSIFLQLNPSHLFINMISLLFIGNFVEKIIGRKRFLWFYLISGVIAGLFFSVLSIFSDINIYAVGASGAIFALGGLLMLLTPNLKVLVFFVIPMRLFYAMIFMLVALWIVSWAAGLPIGNSAHLGGLLAGLGYGCYLRIRYKRKVALLNRMFA